MEAQSWENLLAKVKSAAKIGQMHSSDTGSSGTVHFWAGQVLGSLKVARSTEPGAAAEGQMTMLEQHFPGYLVKVFSRSTKTKNIFGTIARQPDTISKVLHSNKCYRSLKHFVPLLTEFQQLGCAVPCDLKRLQAFADLDSRRSRVSQQNLVLVE